MTDWRSIARVCNIATRRSVFTVHWQVRGVDMARSFPTLLQAQVWRTQMLGHGVDVSTTITEQEGI